jgi:hypothetical protein
MSGEKRTLAEINRDNIRAMERQMQQIRQNHECAMRDAESRNQRNIQQLNKKREEQERRFQDKINQLNSMTGVAIRETNERLEYFRKRQQEQLNQMQSSVSGLVADKKQQQQLADQMIETMNEEIALIQELPFQKYAATEMNQILNRINSVPADNSARITIAHTAIRDLLALESTIEERRLDYEQIHLSTLHAAESLLQLMHNNRKDLYFMDAQEKEFVDENGNKVLVELDFWTEGEYSNLQQRVEAIRREVEENLDTPGFTTDHLKELLAEIDQLNQRQAELVMEAIEKGNSAQIRGEMGDLVMEALEENNYIVEECGYEKGDQRKSVLVKMRHAHNDSEVVVLIYPESINAHQVIVKSLPGKGGYVDEQLAGIRARMINQALRENSIHIAKECEEIQPGNSHTLDDLYDVEAILNEKGEGIPQSVLTNAGLKTKKQHLN